MDRASTEWGRSLLVSLGLLTLPSNISDIWHCPWKPRGRYCDDPLRQRNQLYPLIWFVFILTFLAWLIHQTVLFSTKWTGSRQSSSQTSNSNRPAPCTYSEPQLRWSHETNHLSIYQEESGHSFWEKLMRKAGARQLAELQFCPLREGKEDPDLRRHRNGFCCMDWLSFSWRRRKIRHLCCCY